MDAVERESQLCPDIKKVVGESLRFKSALNRIIQEREPRGESFRSMGDLGVTLFDPLYIEDFYIEPEVITLDSQNESENASETGDQLSYASIPLPEKPISSYASLTVTTETDSDWDCNNSLEVDPESPTELEDCPRVLTEGMMKEIYEALPSSLQTYKWERCFAIGRDGDSFRTLLNNTSPYKYSVIAIRTTEGQVLGGFASEGWHAGSSAAQSQYNRYYGNGQAFLFTSQVSDDSKYLDIYRWSGSNDYCQVCDVEKGSLAMGGVGDFGLIIQDDFHRGATGYSETFGNPPLVDAGNFDIAEFEVYGLASLSTIFSPLTTSSSARSLVSLL